MDIFIVSKEFVIQRHGLALFFFLDSSTVLARTFQVHQTEITQTVLVSEINEVLVMVFSGDLVILMKNIISLILCIAVMIEPKTTSKVLFHLQFRASIELL